MLTVDRDKLGKAPLTPLSMAALVTKLPPVVLPWASVSGSLHTNKGGASEERHARAVQRDITSILLRYSLREWKLGFGMRKGGCQVFV